MAYFDTLVKFDKIVEKVNNILDWFVIVYLGFCFVLAVAGSIISEHENLVYDFATTIPGFAGLVLLGVYQGFKLHSENKPQLTKHKVQITAVLLFIVFLLAVLFIEAKGFGSMRWFFLLFALEMVGWLLKEMICLLLYREKKGPKV